MTFYNDMKFQESLSFFMEEITKFHDLNMVGIIIIISFCIIGLMKSIFNNYIDRNVLENSMVETIWMIIPMLMLLIMVWPSMFLLYLSDELMDPNMTIKITGHQWYWSYEYPDFHNLEFESYLLKSNLENNNFRLLDVDNTIIMPFDQWIRLLVTSSDVLHSWTLPSLGVKMDAVPGRLNQVIFMVNRPGVFFGQCSEICGLNHSFMPIMIESISLKNFILWINNMLM